MTEKTPFVFDDKTLNALKESIKKWEANLTTSYRNVKIRGTDCPLCELFFYDGDNDEPCNGCPVRHHTGRSECYGTPYFRARSAWYNWGSNINNPNRAAELYHMHRFRIHAREEVDFLKSLLPPA